MRSPWTTAKLKSISSNDPRPADDRRSRRPLTLCKMCFSRQLCALLGLPIEMYGIFMQIFRRLPAEAASFHPTRSVEVRLQHRPAFVLSALLIFVLSYINIYIYEYRASFAIRVGFLLRNALICSRWGKREWEREDNYSVRIIGGGYVTRVNSRLIINCWLE